MGATCSSFGYSTRTSLTKSLNLYLKTSGEKYTVNALGALTKLGMQWSELDASLRTAMEDAVVRAQKWMNRVSA